MIQDGIDYGYGFCRATEPGPGVEWSSGKTQEGFEMWEPRSHPEYGFEPDLIYRQPIKAKARSMSDIWIALKHCKTESNLMPHVTLAEAERLGEVAKKMREDMEIKVGDWIYYEPQQLILKVDRIRDYEYVGTSGFIGAKLGIVKITNPVHIQALTEIYEGMK